MISKYLLTYIHIKTLVDEDILNFDNYVYR